VRLMMSKSKSVARKIIVPSGQLSAGGNTRGRTSQISSTSSWPTMQRRAPSVEERRVRGSRLLETSRRAGVWPDSVQVLGGTPASRLPIRSQMWLYSGLRTAEHRGAVWLKRGVPSSQ
jgi:hypothetical protein